MIWFSCWCSNNDTSWCDNYIIVNKCRPGSLMGSHAVNTILIHGMIMHSAPASIFMKQKTPNPLQRFFNNATKIRVVSLDVQRIPTIWSSVITPTASGIGLHNYEHSAGLKQLPTTELLVRLTSCQCTCTAKL